MWTAALLVTVAGISSLVSGSDQLLPPASAQQQQKQQLIPSLSIIRGPLLQTSPRTALPGYRVSGLLILITAPSS